MAVSTPAAPSETPVTISGTFGEGLGLLDESDNIATYIKNHDVCLRDLKSTAESIAGAFPTVIEYTGTITEKTSSGSAQLVAALAIPADTLEVGSRVEVIAIAKSTNVAASGDHTWAVVLGTSATGTTGTALVSVAATNPTSVGLAQLEIKAHVATGNKLTGMGVGFFIDSPGQTDVDELVVDPTVDNYVKVTFNAPSSDKGILRSLAVRVWPPVA